MNYFFRWGEAQLLDVFLLFASPQHQFFYLYFGRCQWNTWKMSCYWTFMATVRAPTLFAFLVKQLKRWRLFKDFDVSWHKHFGWSATQSHLCYTFWLKKIPLTSGVGTRFFSTYSFLKSAHRVFLKRDNEEFRRVQWSWTCAFLATMKQSVEYK